MRSTSRRRIFCKRNPTRSANKETSFVYHDKRGFSLLFGRKTGKIRQNKRKTGSGAEDRPRRSPIFCVQAPETGNNAGVLFAFLCSVKKEQKGVGGRT